MAFILSIVIAVTAASQVFGQTYPCTQGGVEYNHPIPCPLPPCDHPILTQGECCMHCPQTSEDQPDVADCPHPCTINGHHFCHPIPCPLPPCVDPTSDPKICCQWCPNGPNCPAPGGHVIALNHTETIDGKKCTCVHPMMEATCV